MTSFDVSKLPANMQEKVLPSANGCWEWIGARNSTGYGCVTNGKGKSMLSHRKSYELIVGAIPEGLTVDHLCENIVCVNTDHMELVTLAENSRRGNERKTHCRNGHFRSPDSTRVKVRRNGMREVVCLVCETAWREAFNARRRAERKAA